MVAIKNFKMPDSCLHCSFCLWDVKELRCIIDKIIGSERNKTWEKLDCRPAWCPLMAVQNREERGECVCATCESRVLCCGECEGIIKSCEEYKGKRV